MKARKIPISFNEEMVDAVAKYSGKPLALFVREAVAEKLARDFSVLMQGDAIVLKNRRTDLINPSSEKLALMREQAAHARKFVRTRKPPSPL